MSRIKACNVQAMCKFMKNLDEKIIAISPHQALFFRERMNHILAESSRLNVEGTSSGIFEVEIVFNILREAKTMISQLGLDVEVNIEELFAFRTSR